MITPSQRIKAVQNLDKLKEMLFMEIKIKEVEKRKQHEE